MFDSLANWIRWHLARGRLAHPKTGSTDGAARLTLAPSPTSKSASSEQRTVSPPFDRLALRYDAYGARFATAYVPFLITTATRLRLPVARVLDIACGTGTLARALAPHCEHIVGLDASSAMLAVARRLSEPFSQLTFVEGDFRAFDLNDSFDAVVCTSDSLNYLADPQELRIV